MNKKAPKLTHEIDPEMIEDFDDENEESVIHRLREGAFVICSGVPEGTEFGIDYMTYSVGPKFQGIKMIPPGPHFMFTSATDKNSGESGIRSCAFIYLERGEIAVFKWESAVELLVLEKDQQELERIRHEVINYSPKIDERLAPFPEKQTVKWFDLTRFVDKEVIGEVVRKSTFEDSECVDSTCDFTEIPKMFDDKERILTPEELTKFNMDKSRLLAEFVLSRYRRETSVLGELQLSFLVFLLGQDFSAFEQWKKLILLFCQCEDATNTHTELFVNFIRVLRVHMEELPGDFFIDPLTEENFFSFAISSLLEIVQEKEESAMTDDLKELVRITNEFVLFLKGKFGEEVLNQVERQF